MLKSNKKRRKIYLDYASSVMPNPSSIHKFGVLAKRKLENARRDVAQVLNTRPSEIIFTSGGTESNNLALQGFLSASQNKNFSQFSATQRQHSKSFHFVPHIITTNIEHPSVLETVKILAKRKLAQISIIPVRSNGLIVPKDIVKAIKKNTVLVSVMYANNEIGTVEPIQDITKAIRHFNKKNNRKVFFHTDAVQAANYLDLNVEHLGVDMMTLSGSKIFGGGRVGVLYIKKSVPLMPLWGGGDQEMGLRPGTENLPAIVEFSRALLDNEKIKTKEAKRLENLRNYFISRLQHSHILKNVGMLVNGDPVKRLPNNVNITVPKIPSDLLVIELSAKGIMASSKSACQTGDGKASYVIKAINPKFKETDGSVRFSFGRDTKKGDIDQTITALSEILKKLKKWYS